MIPPTKHLLRNVTANLKCCSVSTSTSKGKPTRILPSLKVKCFHNKPSYAIAIALKRLGWKDLTSSEGPHDLHLHNLAIEDNTYCSFDGVRAVNKFPVMSHICNKVSLSKIFNRMKILYPGHFNYYPDSWAMPEEFYQLIDDITTDIKSEDIRKGDNRRNRMFIVKPSEGSNGIGIRLIADACRMQDEVFTFPEIVQEYIGQPLLIDGYKFDFRIYVVISRLDPLEIYICKEGLVRLCTEPYEPLSAENMENSCMHLTNYSLNKRSSKYVRTDLESTGSKRTWSSVKKKFFEEGYDVHHLQMEVTQIALKTVLAIKNEIEMRGENVTTNDKIRHFQILGFDMMLSSDMKLHLLEINTAPSFGILAQHKFDESSGKYEPIFDRVDKLIKIPLIEDTLKLVAAGEENLDMKKSCLQRIYPLESFDFADCLKELHQLCKHDGECFQHNQQNILRTEQLGKVNYTENDQCENCTECGPYASKLVGPGFLKEHELALGYIYS